MASPVSQTVKLSSGFDMPLMGFGICHIGDEATLRTAVEAAIDAGYRMFDSCYLYAEERIIGNILKKIMDDGKVQRKDLFIISQLPYHGMRDQSVEDFCRKSLGYLGMEYLDLFLIHSPISTKRTDNDDECLPMEGDTVVMDDVDYVDTWKHMEKLVDKKLTRSIGLSNFNQKQIERILSNCTITPANLQVECHAYLPQDDLLDFCKSKNIAMTAYAPIGSPDFPSFVRDNLKKTDYHPKKLLDDERLASLATKHNKSPAQILLKYLLQRDISVIPKSAKPAHIIENTEVSGFELDEEDMKVLKSMNEGLRYFTLDWWKGFKDHPHYPFRGDA